MSADSLYAVFEKCCCLFEAGVFNTFLFQSWKLAFFKQMVVFQSRVISSSSPMSIAVEILTPWMSGSYL